MSNQYDLYRYTNRDGTIKDWAVRSNGDGTYTSRWGKTGAKLQSKTFQNMLTKQEHIRTKLSKGYEFVGPVMIGDDGKISTVPPQAVPVEPDFSSEDPRIYWTVKFTTKNHGSFRKVAERIKAVFVCFGKDFDEEPINKSTLIRNSGIIKKEDGVFVFLFLLALKKFAPVGVTVSLSHEDGVEISDQLKLETQALSYFDTDLESIRQIAEEIGLLVKRLDLSTIAPDRQDFYF